MEGKEEEDGEIERFAQLVCRQRVYQRRGNSQDVARYEVRTSREE